MSLRPYQERFVADLLAALRDLPAHNPWSLGCAHPCSVVGQVATGGGKTHSAAELVRRALGGVLPGVHSVAFWADLREITSDTVDRFRGAGLQVGVHAAGHPSTGAPVQVVQVQTATRRLKAGTAPPQADLLILDEAHICEGADLAAALRAAAPRYLVGLTATPSRGDGKGLGRTFARLVQGPQTGELQRQGYLVPCDVIAPGGLVVGNRLAMDPVRAVANFATHPSARVLVFCADRMAAPTAAAFTAAGYAAEVLAADTHPKVRATQRARLTAGELQVLCTVDCAVKGWDCPAVDTVALARGVGVPGAYLQMIGRALRPSPSTGKQRATIIDLKGTVWLHGLPEEERRWSLGGEAVAVVQDLATRYSACVWCAWLGPARPAFSPCPRCAQPLGKPAVPPSVAKAQKLARVAAMTPEQRRRHYEQGLRAQLQRRAGVVPVHRRTAWIDEKVSAAMQRFDAGRAPVEEGSK